MTSTLILYILRAIASLLLPAAAFFCVRTKFSGKLRNFFDGAAVYFIFYCLIYAVVSTYLEMFTSIYDGITGDIALAAVNIAFETVCVALGYLIWFKAVIKKQYDNGVGLMTGVGFSSFVLFFAYALPSVVNTVISALYIKNPDASISAVFEENIYQVGEATPLSLFLDLLIMIFLFVLETAVAAVFYRALRCGNRKIWLAAAVLLRFAAYLVLNLNGVLEDTVIVIILAVITLVAAGAVYSLIKPFVAKKED